MRRWIWHFTWHFTCHLTWHFTIEVTCHVFRHQDALNRVARYARKYMDMTPSVKCHTGILSAARSGRAERTRVGAAAYKSGSRCSACPGAVQCV
jgi:hypothetical protein